MVLCLDLGCLDPVCPGTDKGQRQGRLHNPAVPWLQELVPKRGLGQPGGSQEVPGSRPCLQPLEVPWAGGRLPARAGRWQIAVSVSCALGGTRRVSGRLGAACHA